MYNKENRLLNINILRESCIIDNDLSRFKQKSIKNSTVLY